MNKEIKEQEVKYLENVLENIEQIIEKNKIKIKENKARISTNKKYFVDNYYDIQAGAGTDEFANINIQIESLEKQNQILEKESRRLKKQISTPYFGRFDFKSDTEKTPTSYYVGLGLVQNENEKFVYDWRADICSLYYDDKTGKTSYSCPDGEINGELSLKRQYKIENGNLSYFIDSKMLIDDEILMEQLSKNATAKMHDIVSTIQKEQNILIRADDFKNKIVQGVAGSGKTSIAMHRVSYLLYKYRDKLKSDDILILSPSEMFADYINDVLPALGEEKPFNTTFTKMAKRLLEEPFETREEMLERVISKQKQSDFENIAIKSSFEFLEDLKNFLKNEVCNLFVPKTLTFGEIVIPKNEIQDVYYNKLSHLPIYKRIEILADFITDKFSIPSSRREDLFKRAKKILYNNLMTTDLIRIYNIFLRSVELEEIESIGAYDIAPVMLIKENLFGLKNNYDAKYVIVDEMQDYTPCHFYLFDKIWKCGKLYLGDIYQSIDRSLSPDYLKSLAKLCRGKVKYLNKSYRSTLQISLFSQKILGKHVANNVNRNGEEVECIKTKSCASAIEKIISNNKRKSIAIICKTKDEIKLLQKESEAIRKFKVLDELNLVTKSKKLITTPAKAKGVEFDCVIVPFANDENYCNELDRNLLYVASTRALHKLYFLNDKRPSKFLVKNTTK